MEGLLTVMVVILVLAFFYAVLLTFFTRRTKNWDGRVRKSSGKRGWR